MRNSMETKCQLSNNYLISLKHIHVCLSWVQFVFYCSLKFLTYFFFYYFFLQISRLFYGIFEIAKLMCVIFFSWCLLVISASLLLFQMEIVEYQLLLIFVSFEWSLLNFLSKLITSQGKKSITWRCWWQSPRYLTSLLLLALHVNSVNEQMKCSARSMIRSMKQIGICIRLRYNECYRPLWSLHRNQSMWNCLAASQHHEKLFDKLVRLWLTD